MVPETCSEMFLDMGRENRWGHSFPHSCAEHLIMLLFRGFPYKCFFKISHPGQWEEYLVISKNQCCSKWCAWRTAWLTLIACFLLSQLRESCQIHLGLLLNLRHKMATSTFQQSRKIMKQLYTSQYYSHSQHLSTIYHCKAAVYY